MKAYAIWKPFRVGCTVLLLAFVLAVAYSKFTQKAPPANPDLPSVPWAAFDRAWHDGPVLLLGLGDSVTAGYGASPGRSYFELLAAQPADGDPGLKSLDLAHAFPKLKVKNLSVSGSTSIECLEKQLPGLEVQPEERLGVVCITTGGNDLIHDYGRSSPTEHAMFGATWQQARPWVDAYETRLAGILDAVAAKFPGGCRIFLANIYDPTDGVGDIENAPGVTLPAWPDGLRIHGAFNEVIRRAAAAHTDVYLVDIHGLFLGHGIHHEDAAMAEYNQGDTTYWYFQNLEDPNDAGYDAIRRAFLMEMIKVFRQRPIKPTAE